MELKIKECEICGNAFSTGYAQQKYCPKCGKDPERARREYEWASERLNRHAGVGGEYKERICEACGKTFHSVYGRSYCSDACKEYARVSKARCKVCGRLLIESGNETGKGTCSGECDKRLIALKEAQRIQKAKENGDYIRCKQCGKWFVSKNFGNIFCTNDCRKAYKAVESERVAQKPPGWVDPHTIEDHVCPSCGNTFQCERYMKKTYCSEECRASMAKRKKAARRTEKAAVAEPAGEPAPVHLCTTCKTSQAACERFSSKFVYSPEGSKTKKVSGVWIVHECPKFTGSR